MNEAAVIEAIRNNNNSKAINVLYSQLLPDVKRYIRSNNGKDEDAEDIFQDALVVLYDYIKTGRYNESHSMAGFVMTICRNLWINKAKRDKWQIGLNKVADIAEDVNVNDVLIHKERETLVHESMAKLGPRCQELLILSNFEKLSMKEIVSRMGFENENAAKTRKYKCMQRLIEIVKNMKR